MNRPLLVTARLASPLAGDPPQLDGLLEVAMCFHISSIYKSRDKVWDRHKVNRACPAPPQGDVPIPLAREWLGGLLVSRCSDPILAPVDRETVERYVKKIGVENAGLLAPESRRSISTTNTHTKSFRLPLRVRAVTCVRWFCLGDRRRVKQRLNDLSAIGKKVSQGYGRVAAWEVEDADADYSWFAPHGEALVLMRTLPMGAWLPGNLVGYRQSFAAVGPPYWHHDRHSEAVVPC